MRVQAGAYEEYMNPRKRRRDTDEPIMSPDSSDIKRRATPVMAEAKSDEKIPENKGSPSAEKQEEPLLDRLLSERVVTIYVGPSRTKWSLHENLLSATSDFFRSAFNGGFREASDDAMSMPEDDPAAFELFVRWLYGRTIAPGSTATILVPPDKGRTTIRDYLRLYVLASKFLVEELENAVVDLTHAFYSVGTRRPDIRDVQYIYENTPPRSGMRRLLSTRITLGLFKGKQNSPFTEDWRDVLNSTEDLGFDIVSEISGWNWVSGGNCPSRVVGAVCIFHRHEKGETCKK